uniref:Uncharacterized protein n=1 Tax=Naja naja TaxID=35670 RepID=A0A8C7E418_NAJNA
MVGWLVGWLAGWLAGWMDCAALVGEDQPLCPDLPELDLSELDVNDLDDNGFLGGLKWYNDQSEIISHQYPTETSNIFEVRKTTDACLTAIYSWQPQLTANQSAGTIQTKPMISNTTENSWSNKAKSTCQPQKPQRRPCSELLKYLTTSDDLGQAKQTENRHSNRDKYTSKKKALLHSQMHHLQGR